MKRANPIAAALAALTLAAVVAGCTADQKAAAEKLCRENPAACKQTAQEPDKTSKDPQPNNPVKAEAVAPADAPEALRKWAESQQGEEKPASTVVVTESSVYIGLAGGLRPNGGYKVTLGEVRRDGDGWVAEARVNPPAPGTPVSLALTNPIAFYRLPKVQGQVTVRFAAEVVTQPGQGETGGSAAAENEVSSPNFRVMKPKRVGTDQIKLEGKARVFEGVFRVEVWAGGKMLVSSPVQADRGAPDFGRFEVTLRVPGGVPDGAEVRFLIESMKDGSYTVELTVPVER